MKQRYSNLFHEITRKTLPGTNASLTSFVFRLGGNCYVFSYEKDGVVKHTLIDSGDFKYRHKMVSILEDNNINPANIERIFITHRHGDHSGLVGVLGKISEAEIMVHHSFKGFVDGGFSHEEKMWMGKFDPTRFNKLNLCYLDDVADGAAMKIDGLDFPILTERIPLGDCGTLEVIGCPQSKLMHTTDQILVIYRPADSAAGKERNELLPTDTVVFSGDLWLMKGPMTDQRLRDVRRRIKWGLYRFRLSLTGKKWPGRNPREQDADAKEALKRGFILVTVKPGHHGEFIGSRIVPYGILADRDILVELGYPESDKYLLNEPKLHSKIEAILHEADARFIDELKLWMNMGYDNNGVAGLIARIYMEQSGGGGKIEIDRKERRIRIKAMMNRFITDPACSSDIREIAALSLKIIQKIN
jgi:glyoxylase-like metal-dependent hydrolase (beta-lactamase superfamily II)